MKSEYSCWSTPDGCGLHQTFQDRDNTPAALKHKRKSQIYPYDSVTWPSREELRKPSQLVDARVAIPGETKGRAFLSNPETTSAGSSTTFPSICKILGLVISVGILTALTIWIILNKLLPQKPMPIYKWLLGRIFSKLESLLNIFTDALGGGSWTSILGAVLTVWLCIFIFRRTILRRWRERIQQRALAQSNTNFIGKMFHKKT